MLIKIIFTSVEFFRNYLFEMSNIRKLLPWTNKNNGNCANFIGDIEIVLSSFFSPEFHSD
jgi:hypothetical protein